MVNVSAYARAWDTRDKSYLSARSQGTDSLVVKPLSLIHCQLPASLKLTVFATRPLTSVKGVLSLNLQVGSRQPHRELFNQFLQPVLATVFKRHLFSFVC